VSPFAPSNRWYQLRRSRPWRRPRPGRQLRRCRPEPWTPADRPRRSRPGRQQRRCRPWRRSRRRHQLRRCRPWRRWRRWRRRHQLRRSRPWRRCAGVALGAVGAVCALGAGGTHRAVGAGCAGVALGAVAPVRRRPLAPSPRVALGAGGTGAPSRPCAPVSTGVALGAGAQRRAAPVSPFATRGRAGRAGLALCRPSPCGPGTIRRPCVPCAPVGTGVALAPPRLRAGGRPAPAPVAPAARAVSPLSPLAPSHRAVLRLPGRAGVALGAVAPSTPLPAARVAPVSPLAPAPAPVRSSRAGPPWVALGAGRAGVALSPDRAVGAAGPPGPPRRSHRCRPGRRRAERPRAGVTLGARGAVAPCRAVAPVPRGAGRAGVALDALGVPGDRQSRTSGRTWRRPRASMMRMRAALCE
jgi:hypothetical protein